MARSDSEAESVASKGSAVSFSQKFEPREDDEDTLWEVERITAEKGKLFKVKWKGFDPATGKPWVDSWVEKKDCTPDLVIAWKAEKKEKELRKKATKGRDSAASTSKLPQASKSTSVNTRRGRSSTAATRAATTVSPSTARRQSKSTAVPLFLESEEETLPQSQSQAKAQGKKRKIAEADSAHNSAHVPVDVNVNEAGDAVEPRTAGRPSKKRKIEIETVKQEPTEVEDFEGRDSPSRSRTHTQAQAQATQNEERREVRKLRGETALVVYKEEEEEDEEEEEEERMVEDALSQGYNSPTPVEEEEEEEIPKPTINKGKGRAMDVDSDVDDSQSVIVVVSRPPKKSTTTNGTNTMKSSTKTAKPLEPSTTKPKAKTTKKTKDEVVVESKPPSPPPKFGPPRRKSSTHPNAKTSKPPRTPPPRAAPAPTPAPVPIPAPPTPSATVTPKARINSTRKILRMTTTNEPRRSYARPAKHEKDPDTDTDSDAEPPQLVWTGQQSKNNIVPIEEPSAVWQGDSEVSVLLSPRDLERLRLFDEEVMNVPIPSTTTKLVARGQTIERTASSSKTVMAGKMEDGKGQSKKSGQSGRKEEVEIIDLVSPERSPSPSQKAAQKQPPSTSADVGVGEEKKEDEKLNGNTTMVIDVDPDVEEEEEEEAQPAVPVPSKEPQPQQPNKRDLKSTTPKPKSISSSITAAESKTNGNHYRHRSANDHHEEIIPETEEEESQTQSQSQSRSLNLDLPIQAPAPSYPQPPSTPGGRSTVRSRMKPRTPLSRASSIASQHQTGAGDRDRDRDRPLRPIPEMLPSVFHPHLIEPISSLPESIHDASGSSDNRKNARDEEVVMSSIEQFDSPDKSQRSKQPAKTFVVVNNNTGKGKERQKQKESAEDIWESEVVKRGQEIAEAAKRKSEAERNEVPSNQRQKKTLDEIRAATTRSSRSRSASNVSHVSLGQNENRKGKGKDKAKGKEKALDLIVEKIVEEQDEEMQDLSTSVVPPASGPRATQPEPEPEQPEPEPGHESLTLQEMEAAYVDLNGGAGVDDRIPDPFDDIIALRQEEEESTQDMMMDVIPQRRVDEIDAQAGWDTRPPPPPPPEPTPAPNVVTHLPLDPIPEDENNAGGGVDNEKRKTPIIPEIVIQDPGQSEPSKLQTSEEDPNVAGQMRTTRSRSRSQTPFVTTQTTNGKEKPKTSSKKTSKAGSRQTSLAPPDRPGQSHNDILDRLNVALALNESRMNDITRLVSELASEKLKVSEIQAKADDDHQAMQEAINQINTEFATEKEGLELMVKDSDAKYSELLVEKTEWEAERARLMAELESARQGKVSAEKDRDFFREQYGQASGYVSSVRDENKDLEKRIKIAEDQVQIGVAGVKKTFELRIKALEDDAKSWKKMANFLIEKDRRSDNDHLRRRAAEQPELLARCAHLSANVEALEDRIEELETELEQKTGDWMASREEVQRWKNELTQVHIALTEATTKLERLGRAGGGGHGADPDSNEFVYCCQWRIGYADGGESRACHEVFPTMSGFEEHITNEHLGA